MGTNFLSLISYYAASPLNWISAFFSEDGTRDALTFILIAKIGFAGAFFSCFLRYTYKRRDFSIVVFSSMFALCSYMLGYYWNVMWFDTVALFPLVMLGVVAYTIALALSLISNYYIGYFTCIFTVFMFLAASIIEGRGVKDFFLSLVAYPYAHFIGGCLGAFMLLPAYFGLKLTYSVNNHFPKLTSNGMRSGRIYSQTLSPTASLQREGLPNFACGMLAVALFGVFLFSGGIKIREKIGGLLMLALIAVSCNMNQLNYIWHGFHFTNQIPYRFAFIFSFILAAAAFRAFDIMLKNGVKIYQLILMFMGPFAVFWMNYLSKGDEFSIKGAVRDSMIISGAFWLVFLAAKVFPFRREGIRRAFICIAIGAAVFSESVSNADRRKDRRQHRLHGYPSRNMRGPVAPDHISRTEDSLFYRTEMTSTYTLNDSALYGYNGLSQFSSAANVSVTSFCKRLGLYASEAGNRYYYRTSTPVVNSLFGIKYLIKRGGDLNSEEFAADLEETAESNGGHSSLYKLKYPLSLGFMMNEEVLDMANTAGINPFEYQNEMIKTATGIQEPVFLAQPVTLVKYNNIDVTKNGYGNYTFRIEPDESGISSAVYSFAGDDSMVLYGYASSTGGACDSVTVTCSDDASAEVKTVDSGKLIESFPIVFAMGNSRTGTTSKVEISPKSGRSSGNFKLMVYGMNKSAFQKAYDALADEQLELTRFDDTRIEGSITAKQDGVLFLSMPYEKGWSVYVDGEEAETFKVFGAMTGVRVKAGQHRIKLRYSPEGFNEGVILTVISLSFTGAIIWFERRRRRKNVPELSDSSPEQSQQPPEKKRRRGIFRRKKAHRAPAHRYTTEEINEEPESFDGLQGD